MSSGALSRQASSPELFWNVEVIDASPAEDVGFKMYGEQPSLQLLVTFKNEEGHQALVLPAEFRDLLLFELAAGTRPLPVTSQCASEVVLLPGRLPTSTGPYVIQGGSGLQLECEIRPRRNASLPPGEYRLGVSASRLRPALRFDDLTQWQGRMIESGSIRVQLLPIDTSERLKESIRAQADAHARHRQHSEALGLYKKLIALDPSDIGAFVGTGNAYLVLEQYKEAAAAFERAIAGGRVREGLVPYSLAYAYVALGQEEKAAGTLRLVLPADRIPAQIEEYRKRSKRNR